MHRYIEAQRQVWRRGVILNNGSAHLEAIEHPNRGEIALRVSGTHKVENNPTLKNRVVGALKGAGEKALEQAIDHPAAKVFIAGAKGFIKP